MPTTRYGEWPYQYIKSTNVVKLPDTRNSLDALRYESLIPDEIISIETEIY